MLAICRKWQAAPAVVGEVTDSGLFRVLRGDEVTGEMPVEALVDGCPLYDLEPEEPSGWIYGNERTLETDDPGEILLELLASPSIASKKWAFEQYDSIVGSRTVRRPETADAAVLQLPETGNAIATSIDGNGRRVACDPYRGAVEAVLECAQNLACVGAEPLGLTNCLNFGNPEKPAVAWQLDRAVQGLADACNAMGVPVVGGNVSLYNETDSRPDLPHARRRPRRRASGRAQGRRPGALRRRRDRAGRAVRPVARGIGAHEAARRARAGPARDRPRRAHPRARASSAKKLAPETSRSTTSPTAASPARSPRWRSPAGSARAATSTP